MQDHVTFWGSLPEEMKFSLLKSCDVCVFPSRLESFGIVVLEGMAAGKPVISTRIGGIPEILKDGRNGLLVPPAVAPLCDAMEFAAENEEFRREAGRNNAADVLRFSWKNLAREYVEMYEGLLRK